MAFPVITLTGDPVFDFFFSLIFYPGLVVIHAHILLDMIDRV